MKFPFKRLLASYRIRGNGIRDQVTLLLFQHHRCIVN
jgi:hypothetical protein